MTEDMSQTTIAVDGEDIAFGFPFSKINSKDRTVEGFATLDNIDKGGEIVDNAASKEAFGQWLGNVREMHGPKAVGKAVSVEERTLDHEGKTYSGFWVKSRISKGAEDTWQKILDGTLAGYSIGGRVYERRPEVIKNDSGKFSTQRINRITKYMLGELSLVDNPMNPLSMLEGISKGYLIKMVGDDLYAGDGLVENKGLFYCSICDVTKMDDGAYSEIECPTCDAKALRIGEVAEMPTFTELRKMVDAHMNKGKVPPQLVAHQFKPKGGADAPTAGDAPDTAECATCGKTKAMHAQMAKSAGDLMCPQCGFPVRDDTVQCPNCQVAGSGVGITPVPALSAPMKKDAGPHVDKEGKNNVQDETTSGFGAPTDLTPQPPMESVNDTLRHEVAEATPQSSDVAPTVKSDALDAQKAEGDEMMLADRDAIVEAVSEALNGRVELFRRSHRKKTEDVMFVESLLDMDMYRAVTNAHKTPPKGYPADSAQYGDPVNKKYPLDTSARVRSAMAYFNAPGQRSAGGYSMVQWAAVGKRIASAANTTFGKGHSFANGRIVGPNVTKADTERGELVINLQKNDSDGNNGVVGVLQTFADYLRESTDDSPINKGGETQTLDINTELEKILDILTTAAKEFGDVMKAFTVTEVNSENKPGPTLGGGDTGDEGVGVPPDGATFATNDATTATATALPSNTDAGPDKVVPDAISSDDDGMAATDGTATDPGTVTADSGPEKVLPHADLGKAEPSELTDLLKAVVSKMDDLGTRIEKVETSGGGKKSGEVVDEKLSKSDESFWGSSFYNGELENR